MLCIIPNTFKQQKYCRFKVLLKYCFNKNKLLGFKHKQDL